MIRPLNGHLILKYLSQSDQISSSANPNVRVQLKQSFLMAVDNKQYLVYCFSNQSMKKLQNLPENKAKQSDIVQSHYEESETDSLTLHKQKSIPKFNRKTQIKTFSRKKSDTNIDIDQAICYISPKRSTKDSIRLFRSPKFQDVAHKFAATLFDSSTSRVSEALHQKPLSESVVVTGCRNSQTGSLIQFDSVDRKELDSLRLELEQLKKENKKIRDKLRQMQNLETFLVERQSFIYQLQENNRKLHEDLSAANGQKESLQRELQRVKSELNQKLHSLQSDYAKLENKCDAQQAEVNLMLKKNVKLKEQVKSLKQSKNQQQKINSLNKRFKENNENFNRSQQLSLTKSKSAFFQTVPLPSFAPKPGTSSPLDISQIQPDSSANGDNETVADLCENLRGTLQGSDLGFNEWPLSDNPFACQNITNKPFLLDQEKQDCHQTIKMLRQKIRYSQIEIDVLKKLKVDKDKVQEENNKLKSQNRKLLHRIDFIARESSRHRCVCDSELQLSLSPNKH